MSKMSAEMAQHDLTLVLLYLSRFIDDPKTEDFWNEDVYRAWKGYDFDVLNKLEEEEFVFGKHRNKSICISKEGIDKAKEIMERLGIDDWERK